MPFLFTGNLSPNQLHLLTCQKFTGTFRNSQRDLENQCQKPKQAGFYLNFSSCGFLSCPT